MRGAIIKKLSIEGFKSIKKINDFELNDLNIIIGANGAGKSNFIQIFRMLIEMTKKNFSKFILENGGADNFLFNGPKNTASINVSFDFNSHSGNSKGINSYQFKLSQTVDETFIIDEERKYFSTEWRSYGTPSAESCLYDEKDERSFDDKWNGVGYFVYKSISNWMVYHFHDTSSTAPMRRSEIVDDCNKLRENGSNIAPFLLNLREDDDRKKYYKEILNAVRLVTPFFDDFILDIKKMGEAEKVKLNWTQKNSDYPMQPYQLSDGSIRFICLATALLQPNPPSTIIIDEPELGLHPEAISILAELIIVASKRTQIIIATQSPALINNFAINDIIVVNRKGGASTFERLKEKDFSVWLEDYSVGELWEKNVITGGPVHE